MDASPPNPPAGAPHAPSPPLLPFPLPSASLSLPYPLPGLANVLLTRPSDPAHPHISYLSRPHIFLNPDATATAQSPAQTPSESHNYLLHAAHGSLCVLADRQAVYLHIRQHTTIPLLNLAFTPSCLALTSSMVAIAGPPGILLVSLDRSPVPRTTPPVFLPGTSSFHFTHVALRQRASTVLLVAAAQDTRVAMWHLPAHTHANEIVAMAPQAIVVPPPDDAPVTDRVTDIRIVEATNDGWQGSVVVVAWWSGLVMALSEMGDRLWMHYPEVFSERVMVTTAGCYVVVDAEQKVVLVVGGNRAVVLDLYEGLCVGEFEVPFVVKGACEAQKLHAFFLATINQAGSAKLQTFKWSSLFNSIRVGS